MADAFCGFLATGLADAGFEFGAVCIAVMVGSCFLAVGLANCALSFGIVDFTWGTGGCASCFFCESFFETAFVCAAFEAKTFASCAARSAIFIAACRSAFCGGAALGFAADATPFRDDVNAFFAGSAIDGLVDVGCRAACASGARGLPTDSCPLLLKRPSMEVLRPAMCASSCPVSCPPPLKRPSMESVRPDRCASSRPLPTLSNSPKPNAELLPLLLRLRNLCATTR
mmetsp:Transcript_14983/g.26393  ORF Transcript_14983/g.26393 Transcript_14983/m.26393 type:complete len:228 (+) Transcript_14983:1685-2368(+)